jgi:hypothetical protein
MAVKTMTANTSRQSTTETSVIVAIECGLQTLNLLGVVATGIATSDGGSNRKIA